MKICKFFFCIFWLSIAGQATTAEFDWCDLLLREPIIPKGARVINLPTENFIRNRVHHRSNPEEASYSRSLDRIRLEGIVPILKDRADPLRPYYLLGGSDAGALVRLFPNAEIYTATSEVGFFYGLPTPNEVVHFQKGSQARFRYEDHLHNERKSGAQILGTLAKSAQGFRIRGVLAFEIPGEPLVRVGTNFVTPVHTIIAFDQGEGTKLKYHVQLQINFDRGVTLCEPWWMQNLYRSPADALLVKASMQLFTQKAGPFRILKSLFLQGLRTTHGILIEPLDHFSGPIAKPYWEFSWDDIYPKTDLVEVGDLTFGYPEPGDGRARVHRFIE